MLNRNSIVPLLVVLSACTDVLDPAASTPAEREVSSEGFDTEASEDPADDDLFCQQLAGEDCDDATTPNGLRCRREFFTPTRIVDGTCELGEAVELCVADDDEPAVTGCSSDLVCDPGTAFYSVVDGVMMMRLYCGGRPPIGWNHCETTDPQSADPSDPAECGCWCGEPEPGGSTSQGEPEDSGSTGSA